MQRASMGSFLFATAELVAFVVLAVLAYALWRLF